MSAHYLSTIESLQNLISLSNKTSYLLSMGKLNPSKLANFLEIDIFVLVSCPENALLDSKPDYLKPIITPWELELALEEGKEWDGSFLTGLEGVATGIRTYLTQVQSETEMEGKVLKSESTLSFSSPQTSSTLISSYRDESLIPEFSLITGKLETRNYRRGLNPSSLTRPHLTIALDTETLEINSDTTPSSSQIAKLGNQCSQVGRTVSRSGDLLSQRSWKGLEVRLGEGPLVDDLVVGRGGIAKGYQGEGIQ